MDIIKNNKTEKFLSRDLIYIISRNSNWTKSDIDKTLAANVYAEKKALFRFFDFFLLALGVGFAASGAIFFFAYNWDEMTPFIKVSIVCALLIGSVTVSLFVNMPPTAKKIILTGAALLVGVLLAVYGQVYQTGANSWEMFAEWAVFIVIWTFVANFAPLWMLLVILLNTTFILYTNSFYVDFQVLLFFLFLFNGAFVVIGEMGYWVNVFKKRTGWLLVTVLLFTALCSTVGIIMSLFDANLYILDIIELPFAWIIAMCLYILMFIYSIYMHYTSYLLIIAASVIAIATALLAKILIEPFSIFLCGFFIVVCISLTTHYINKLNKRWYGNK